MSELRSRAAVLRRTEAEAGAMPWSQRVRMQLKHIVAPPTEETEERDEEASGAKLNAQYCLQGTTQEPSFFKKVITCNRKFARQRKGEVVVNANPNQKLALSLHWMFRVNFLFLFLVMCITFFMLVILFSGFIALAGRMDSECVRIGGDEFDSAGAAFADAFALSWTTFSTVGYGSTYPALGHENDSRTNCFFINFICSLESLLGVLYSGFCGAILFGKVLRIQSHAQVIFSDPLLIRYGSGVVDKGLGDDGHQSSDDEAQNTPCPVLEFRVLNRLFNEVGGEIMDASLNVVANINANDADPSMLDEGASSIANSTHVGSGDSTSDEGSFLEASSRDQGSMHSFSKFIGNLSLSRRDHHAVDEDPSCRVIQHKQIFSKLLIEAPEHPFFKRCWVATHVLDEHSPILKPRVRRHIRRNGGVWPEKFNNAESIRDALQFNQILVSLNGVSNISASDVYAQKIYDFVDVHIGYQFVNILYRDIDGALGVDTDLINDVKEQTGGGGEPLLGDLGEE